MRHLLYVINAVFVLIGAGIIISGAMIYQNLMDFAPDAMFISPALMSIGAVIIVSAFVGVGGTYKRHRCSLLFYFAIVTLVGISLFIGSISAFVLSDEVSIHTCTHLIIHHTI